VREREDGELIMAWKRIYEADLLIQISGDELEAIRAAALAENQADPVIETIDQVTREVRGFVAACAANSLDRDKLKIPDELIGHAVAIIVPRLCGRVAGLAIDKEKVRSDALKTAMAVLQAVAACKFAIVQTETPTEEEVGAAEPRFPTTERTRRFDRESSQDGI
jgi:hypothetical protein